MRLFFYASPYEIRNCKGLLEWGPFSYSESWVYAKCQELQTSMPQSQSYENFCTRP